jgi:hypothetical protein
MATTMTRPSRKTNGAGIGLRLPHIAEVVATGPSILLSVRIALGLIPNNATV